MEVMLNNLQNTGILAAMLLLASSTVVAPIQSSADTPETAAKRVESVLTELESREKENDRQSRTYVLVETDMNAYLASEIAKRERKDVEHLSVKMNDENRFITLLTVNLDNVDIKADGMTKTLFRTFLRGTQTIEMDGKLTTDKGKGTYEVQSATMNGVPLPATLVNAIISAVGKQQDPPFDPTEPFDLPYKIQTIVVSSGKTTIKT